MYNLKKSLIAFAGLLALLGAIALITPRRGVGQNVKQPQDVRLVGTTVTQPVSASSPLPVSGNVGITGTPVVGLDSGNNTVKIDTTNPLAVRDVDNPARQPFTAAAEGNWIGTDQYLLRLFHVPVGKRLVIEQVSVLASVTPSASQKVSVSVTTNLGDLATFYTFASVDYGTDGGFSLFLASSQMRAYADAGTVVRIRVRRNDISGGDADYSALSLSGYLIDVP